MLIVGNWKAYVEDFKQAKVLLETAKKLVSGKKQDTPILVLAPSLPYLHSLAVSASGPVRFAVQDVSIQTSGAHTGEVPATTLQQAGARYAILGHSERRALGEANEVVGQKAALAISSGLIPIVCIGEAVRDSESHYLQFLRAQIDAVFTGIARKDRARVIFAYEPIWAIGKSAAIEPPELDEMMRYIRKVLGDYVLLKEAESMTIIYGGSVDPFNIRALAEVPGVGGFLIGRASVDPLALKALVKAVSGIHA